MMKSDNPRTKLGKMTIQPVIKSIQLQPGSKSTYQVRWAEESYSLSGNASNKRINYVALCTVGIDPPSKEDELLINPLGLKIQDLSISVESTSTLSPSTTTTSPSTNNEPETSRGGAIE